MKTSVIGLWLLTAAGCPEGAADTEVETTPSSEGDTGDAEGERCSEVAVACVDAAIAELSLQEELVSAGTVNNTRDGADWVSQVDATAGGVMVAAMNPWVYLRFTDAGLERVELDDVAALASSEWDIAAKRFGIRVNSGVSGPSCVTVAAPGGTYAALQTAPAEASFAAEDFFTADCTLVEDDSGQPGNPAYRMAGWWGYSGCVSTTGAPYVLRLADGRTIKLVVEAYYEAGQEECNASGAMGTGAAKMTWRWGLLP